MQIDSMIVRNYRCIGEVKLDKLSPITILVGRNNTGKSGLLEAFALGSTGEAAWHDSLGSDLIETIIERRGGWEYADMMIKIGEPSAEIHVRGKNIAGTVQITRSIEDLSNSSIVMEGIEDHIEAFINMYEKRIMAMQRREGEGARERASEFNADRMREQVDLSRIKAYIGYNDELNGKFGYAVLIGREALFRSLDFFRTSVLGEPTIMPSRYFIRETIRSPPSQESRTIFLLTPSIQYLNELQSRLASSGELLGLIKSLREKINYFVDIREVNKNFLVFLNGLKRPIPLGSMGDGFRAQLAILAAIFTVKSGIVLMEEPEIRLHPGFMGSIANEIVNTASTGDIQYIISTHSSDFLEFLLEANAELIKVIRMYLVKGAAEIDYEVFDGKEAAEELDELKMDLRGV